MRTSDEVLNEIRRHGEETYPEECCGFLLGRLIAGEHEVIQARRSVNRNEDRRADRYIIAPEDYVAADREARSQGLDIVGMYHSHPDHPARPSATDLAQATFPGYTYVIVSVNNGSASDLTAWTLAPDRTEFRQEALGPKSKVQGGA